MQMQGQLIEINFPVKAIAWGLSCLQKSILQGALEEQCASSGTPLQRSRHEHSLVLKHQLFSQPPQACPGLERTWLNNKKKKIPSSPPNKTKP